ncbi:MAG: hypothetical protein IJW64_05435 [Clostridia bacterium]|nr:hypothetical protein [Clostridia bacterium]
MRARNALKIAMGNYSLVFKNLLYKFAVFSIFALSLGLILKIAINPFVEAFRPVLKALWGVVTAIVSGDAHDSARALLKGEFNVFLTFLSDNIGGIVWMVVIVVVFVLVYRFVTGVSDCTLMILVNGHMTDMSHRGYLVVMIENLKKILVYQLIDAFSTVIYSVVVGVIVWGVFKLLILVMPLLALFGCGLVLVLAVALYSTVFSQVMANLLIGGHKSVKTAFASGFVPKKEYFFKMFASYLAVALIIVYLYVSVAIFTFGVGLLLLIPFSSLLVVCMKTVDFFTINKKKYFVDYDTIVVPKELRENDEKLLSDEIEI